MYSNVCYNISITHHSQGGKRMPGTAGYASRLDPDTHCIWRLAGLDSWLFQSFVKLSDVQQPASHCHFQDWKPNQCCYLQRTFLHMEGFPSRKVSNTATSSVLLFQCSCTDYSGTVGSLFPSLLTQVLRRVLQDPSVTVAIQAYATANCNCFESK